MSSDTPRTDAVSIPYYAIKLPQFPRGHYDVNVKFVVAGEMEKIERELQTANRDIDALISNGLHVKFPFGELVTITSREQLHKLIVDSGVDSGKKEEVRK